MSGERGMIGHFKRKKIAREEGIVVTRGGDTPIDESYNRLKDNIIYYSDGGKHKVIQIESAIMGEGKTTLVSNLAVSLAFNDKKVAIVDVDFRRARLHRAFRIECENGISDCLSGEKTLDQVIKHTEYGVDVVTRGGNVPNSSLVLTSDKFRSMIESLAENYDFVLLDCPPVLLISDYINIARYSDGILFVSSFGYTKKSAIREAVALLRKTGREIIGAAMTFANSSTGKYGYSRYGYRGYGYGYSHYGHRGEEK